MSAVGTSMGACTMVQDRSTLPHQNSRIPKSSRVNELESKRSSEAERASEVSSTEQVTEWANGWKSFPSDFLSLQVIHARESTDDSRWKIQDPHSPWLDSPRYAPPRTPSTPSALFILGPKERQSRTLGEKSDMLNNWRWPFHPNLSATFTSFIYFRDNVRPFSPPHPQPSMFISFKTWHPQWRLVHGLVCQLVNWLVIDDSKRSLAIRLHRRVCAPSLWMYDRQDARVVFIFEDTRAN